MRERGGSWAVCLEEVNQSSEQHNTLIDLITIESPAETNEDACKYFKKDLTALLRYFILCRGNGKVDRVFYTTFAQEII